MKQSWHQVDDEDSDVSADFCATAVVHTRDTLDAFEGSRIARPSVENISARVALCEFDYNYSGD